MAAREFDITGPMPRLEAGFSGNLLDPLDVSYNKALGSFGALPPYLAVGRHTVVHKVDKDYDLQRQLSVSGLIYSVMPLKMRLAAPSGSVAGGGNPWFYFPTEPLVAVSGKNNIIRRTVAKSRGRGTVKERWSHDDYEITIQGVIINYENKYPEDYVKQLAELLAERRSVEIDHGVLLALGIKFMAIESVNLPFTKGIENQTFEIKGYSDEDVNLLIEG